MGSLIPLFFLGYYGFGNWGDELSLLATLKTFEDIAREYSLSFRYWILSGSAVLPFPLPEKARIVPRWAIPEVLAALLKSSLVVVGGGSLLQDVTSLRSLLYYGAFLALAKGTGKRLVFFGCGLGPFRRRGSEWIVRRILRNSGVFLARDEETFRTLERYGLSPISLMADPVFLLWDRGEAHMSSRVAVFLRRQAMEKREALCREFEELQREGAELEFAAFHRDEDWDVARFFGEHLGAPTRYFESVGEVLSYFENLKGVLSMRFHPLVLATCAGVPWYAFDIDPKIRSFSAHWSRKNLCTLSELGSGVLSFFLRDLKDLREETLRLRGFFVQRALGGKRELANFLLGVLRTV